MKVMDVFKDIMDDVHSDALIRGLQDTIRGIGELGPLIRAESLESFLQKKRMYSADIRKMSNKGILQLGKSLQKQAGQSYDHNMSESFALWLVGAWLEGQVRESEGAYLVFDYIEQLANSLDAGLEDDESYVAPQEDTKALINQTQETILEVDTNSTYEKLVSRAEDGDPDAQVEIAMSYLREDDADTSYKDILKWLRKAEEVGHPRALYLLGLMHQGGDGIKQSKSKAIEYFEKAAEKKEIDAINALAEIYLEGYGVDKDIEKAKSLLLSAAEMGDPKAQGDLAWLLYFEPSDDTEYGEAYSWVLPSAKQGYMTAQVMLGDFFYRGEFVEKDYLEAIKWFEKAFENNSVFAAKQLGWIYWNGEGVSRNVDKAFQYFSRYETDDPEVEIHLGHMYKKGIGVSPSNEKAFHHYHHAAQNNIPEAQLETGLMLKDGIGTTQDKQLALKWLGEASDNGVKEANLPLGILLLSFENVNFARAEECFTKVAENGDPRGNFNLANTILMQKSPLRDSTAFYHYDLAAGAGINEAHERLGYCYENGVAVEKNHKSALKEYQTAVKAGVKAAEAGLHRIKSNRAIKVGYVFFAALLVLMFTSIVFEQHLNYLFTCKWSLFTYDYFLCSAFE